MNLLRDECEASGRKAIVITHEPLLVDPKGSCRTGGVARWLEIARDLDLEVLAVADLDALFSPGFDRTADKIDRIRDAYMDQREADSTREVIRPLHEATQGKVQPDAAARREWLISVLASDGAFEEKLRKRAMRLLAIWRDAGIWLHPQGDLERALGMEDKDKPDTRTYAPIAEHETGFDAAVRWALYRFDGRIGVQAMLESEVERIAQEIQRSLRLHPELNHTRPVGPTAEADSRSSPSSPSAPADIG